MLFEWLGRRTPPQIALNYVVMTSNSKFLGYFYFQIEEAISWPTLKKKQLSERETQGLESEERNPPIKQLGAQLEAAQKGS